MKKIQYLIILVLGVGSIMSSTVSYSAESNASHSKACSLVKRILRGGGNVSAYTDNKKDVSTKKLEIDNLSTSDVEKAYNIMCRNISMTPEDIETLASLKRLRYLGFEKMDVSSALVEAIGAQKWNLEILGFRHGSLPDDFGKLIKNLKGVEGLGLVCLKMSDTTLEGAGGLGIEILCFIEAPITDGGLKSMLPLDKLKVLSLSCTKITDRITEVIDSCPKLKNLSIFEADMKCSFLRDMKHTDGLIFIEISKTNLGDEVFRSITRFKNLDHLKVYSKHITKKSIPVAEAVAKKAWSVTVSNEEGKLFRRVTDDNYKYDQ